MGLKDLIENSFVRPRLMQLEYAEKSLEGKNTKPEEYLAAVNMGIYPFESRERILEKVREEKVELENELGVEA